MLRLAVENPVRQLTPVQVFVRLACRSFLMATLQAGGVWLIAQGSLWAGLTGFLISYNWATASRDVADYRIRYSGIAYGVGGGLGTFTVLLVARYL